MSDHFKKSIGLSLGTTSVSIAVLHKHNGELPEVMAFDRVPCRFLRDGVIVNLEALQDAVTTCKNNIACVLKTSFSNTVINLCGVPVKQEDGIASLELKRKKEISRRHLMEVNANRLYLDDDSWRLVHNNSVSFNLDSQTGLASPVGMCGKTLQAQMRQIYAPATIVECVLHALDRCGFGISDILIDPLASAESLVTDDEREMGIWIVDIGGRVIQLAHLKGNQVSILPFIVPGSDSVNSDIAILLNTTIKDAEQIKIKYGCALTELASNEISVHIPPLGGGPVQHPATQHRLAEIIKSRTEELLELASRSIAEYSQNETISQGIILTGGGSMLPGTIELAAKFLGQPVIRGHFRNVTSATELPEIPLCASAIGLALHGLKTPGTIKRSGNFKPYVKQSIRTMIKWFGGTP